MFPVPQSTQPSRRTIVKGAAWATPALVVASSVPAIAASPDDELCEIEADELGWFNQKADSITWTKAVGSDSSTISGRKGTFFDTRLGTWQFGVQDIPKFANHKITGYKVNWKSGLPIVIRTVDKATFESEGKLVAGPSDPGGNNEFTGRWTLTPNSGPLVVGAGLVYTGSMQTNMPYWFWCSPTKYERAFVVSVPFSVTFIRGLNPAGIPQPEVTCNTTYYWNAVMYSGAACQSYNTKESTNWVSAGLPTVEL